MVDSLPSVGWSTSTRKRASTRAFSWTTPNGTRNSDIRLETGRDLAGLVDKRTTLERDTSRRVH